MRDWVVGGAVIEVRAWDGTGPDGPPDALLLVENRRANGTSDWTPPGGVIDEGESVVDGLTREVREETGLTVERWHGLLYEIEASAPGLGWNLRVEVHRAGAVLGPLRTGADPDGIVVGSAWAAGPRCVDLLGGTHPWVREPLLEWMAQRWDEPRRFRYRISGSGRDDLTVERW